MGSVQSGKTGAMGGIAARALDSGYRVVVVLSGLKDDLRAQTALRLRQDLLRRGNRMPFWRDGRWVSSDPPVWDTPEGWGAHGPMKNCWSPEFWDDANHDDAFRTTVDDRLMKGDAILAVIKKNRASLERVHEALAYVGRRRANEVVPILVLDDECDEASVATGGDRPTAASVRRLLIDNLQQPISYVGVTATIAANILQDVEDPLFPRDFIELARYPAHMATSLTYEEPNPDARYTGSQVFYQLMQASDRKNFLVESTMSAEEQAGAAGGRPKLEEALIAYFVGGAMRLAEHEGASFESPGTLPDPHTMMIHTDGSIANHRRLAQELVEIIQRCSGDSELDSRDVLRQKPKDRLRPSQLMAWLDRDQQRWRDWYDRFIESRSSLTVVYPSRATKASCSWEETRSSLAEVFGATKLRVINSDDSADPPMDFQARYAANGPIAPEDVYSVFIGGNRLSRGLTIEGLTVSYYTRDSSVWTEDTAVQRERWFGYRGQHLEFCRLFVHIDTAVRLLRFHEHEFDLRQQFSALLSSDTAPTDTAYRLMCLPGSIPTGSAASKTRGTICLSGARVFVDRVQMGASPPRKGIRGGERRARVALVAADPQFWQRTTNSSGRPAWLGSPVR